jgi:hypothetical protein
MMRHEHYALCTAVYAVSTQIVVMHYRECSVGHYLRHLIVLLKLFQAAAQCACCYCACLLFIDVGSYILT